MFIFIDTEKHASPFDILTTADIFPDALILKYEGVTVEDVEQIVYDTMFPRGPEGAKHTKIFINGRDLKTVNDVLERAAKCMFPPFELAIIVDPRGAYTTASAAVAKTLQFSIAKGFGTLKGKTIVILAGTGPVGQTAARLYASEKTSVIITSRDLQKAVSLAARMNEELGDERVQGVKAQTAEETGKAIEQAEIVLSAGAAGTQILSLDLLRNYAKRCRVVADINAIPPLGVEGLEADADGKEIPLRAFGIGALAIGKLKNQVEIELIKKAAIEPKGIFDYKIAYEIAKRIVLEKTEEKRKTAAETPKYWLP